VHGWHLLIKTFIQFMAAQVRGAGLVIDAGKASDMSFTSSKRTGPMNTCSVYQAGGQTVARRPRLFCNQEGGNSVQLDGTFGDKIAVPKG
jgi:hypothetical protein